MSEHEVIGQQLMKIQELQKKYDILISMIRALKTGEIDIECIKLQDHGFTVIDEADILHKEIPSKEA
tara:strand:+ start:857 stop:1057 length:201 start_codon:yes stop_codon:yes gene_type:complete